MSLKFPYLKKLMVFLRAQPVVGGLEITDSALRFTQFNGREWQMVSLRLPPEIVRSGKILDYGQLVGVLKKLKEQLPIKSSRREKALVVVSLGSLNIYTQVINLPILEESRLDEAVRLNTQMVSPTNAADVYSDWQIAGKEESERKLEVLTAFVGRQLVDEMSRALREAGFLPVALESRALSLARLAREQGVELDKSKSYILLSLDNEILDFLVVKHGQLYFEYLNYWRDLRGDNKVISLLDFRGVVAGNLRQVLNFYSQHWTDKVEGVFLVAAGLSEELKRIVSESFALNVKDLKLRLDRPVGAEWYGVLGSGLRGVMERKEDRDISLLGTTARDEFRGEQFISFMKFWRILIPVALGVIFLVLLAGSLILERRDDALRAEVKVLDNTQVKEVESLKDEAKNFNRLVGLVGSLRSPEKMRISVLEKINKLLTDHGITLTRFGFRDFNSPVVLLGQSKSKDQIIEFENALTADRQITGVNLPLTEIKEGPQGFSFSISFSIVAFKTE